MIKINECIKYLEKKINNNQNTTEVEYFNSIKKHLEGLKEFNKYLEEENNNRWRMIKNCRQKHNKWVYDFKNIMEIMNEGALKQ